MTVLALDISANCGWALHASGWSAPRFGSVPLPSAPGMFGGCMDKLYDFLATVYAEHPDLSAIVWEAQHLPSHGNLGSVEKLMAMAHMAEWFAYTTGIDSFKIEIATWRKHFLGTAPPHWSKGRKVGGWTRDTAKPAAMRVCAAYGWVVPDDDAAEACGILDYFLSLVGAEHVRPWRDALLMRRPG